MTDTPAKPNGRAINDHATIADLRAKKERQQTRIDDASPAIALSVSAQATENDRDRSPAKAVPKLNRPDRAGKKLIAGYFSPETQKALKHVGVDEGLTLQQVMAEAFTLYLTTKGKLPKW